MRSDASLISVLIDFTISVLGSSCNSLIFGLILSSFPCLSIKSGTIRLPTVFLGGGGGVGVGV